MTFFILGTHPELSIAEIEAVVGKKPVIAQSAQVLVLDDVDENLGELQNRLGGTIKIGNIIGELSSSDLDEAIELIAASVSQAAGKNKISFGLSVYDLGGGSKTRQHEQELHHLGKEIKNKVKELERPVRYVSSKEPRLSSVIVEQNGLLASGGEYVFLIRETDVLVGQTESVQDFKSWSARDYGRPASDPKSGMLPPKLARLMINLAGVELSGKTLLDPFCGSGTVLMEAALMGLKKIVASDISEKAVEDTAQNLTWLVDEFKLEPPSLSLFTSPAQELDQVFTKKVDLIVTETYLGTPRTRPLSPQEFTETRDELIEIYEPSLETLFGLLKEDGRVVIAIPAFTVGSELASMELQGLFEHVGFTIEHEHLYKRPNQIVAREIFVLKK
ncbi:MAG: DNA methyltransferase [Patescibacteria group bacterium]